MKAITTKYIGPTNTKGTRIKAFDFDGNQVTVRYDYELNLDENHKRAAEALKEKMGWKMEIVGGGVKGGMVWVFVKGKGEGK